MFVVLSWYNEMLSYFINFKSQLGNNRCRNIFSFCFRIFGAIIWEIMKSLIILLLHINIVILLSPKMYESCAVYIALTLNSCTCVGLPWVGVCVFCACVPASVRSEGDVAAGHSGVGRGGDERTRY